ncbi:unnamed protein product [Ascophyllum nodosum]
MPSSGMSSSQLSSLAQGFPLKRHRNTFLFPRQKTTKSDAECPTGDKDGPLALVVLNTTADAESKDLLRQIWARAGLRICADGGANRLHDSFDADPPGERERYVPDMIVGDLDSLRPEVAAFYEGLGTEVKQRPDQDHNDFEKCLIEVEARLLSTRTSTTSAAGTVTEEATAATSTTVVGLGAFGGRFDHEMAAISLLHSYTSRFDRLVLVGAGNVAFLLLPGRTHVLELDERFEGPTVGLIPVGGACTSVTTEGLKWDLNERSLEFGVLVSSSNEVAAKEVRVTTDAPLVWNAQVKVPKWIDASSGQEGATAS